MAYHYLNKCKYLFAQQTVNSLPSCHPALRKCVAFTLAEVLITLGIIGVVAAMTLPTMITHHRNETLKNQLKKTYNELSQINQKFVLDYSMNICEYDWNLVDSGLSIKDASTQLSIKFAEYFITKNKQKSLTFYNGIKNLNGEDTEYTLLDDGINQDLLGRTYYFEFGARNYGKCPMITVDINGASKGPNQLGKDIFSFRFAMNNKVIPIGNPDAPKNNLNGNSADLDLCSYNNSDKKNGFGCAHWAIIDKNPDDNTKSYWNNFIK